MPRNVKFTGPNVTGPVALSTKVSADTRRAIEQASVDERLTVREVIEIAVAARFGAGPASNAKAS